MPTDGLKYHVHFVDDFTRFTWIFSLKLKSNTVKTFLRFHKLVQTQFNTTIKCLQSDWGVKFRPHPPILNQLGIQFRHPCPRTHQQNGKVEMKHQHIIDLSLILLSHAELPLKFWCDYVVSSTFLINRLPTKSLNQKSTFETLHSRKPDYKFLKLLVVHGFPFFVLIRLTNTI